MWDGHYPLIAPVVRQVGDGLVWDALECGIRVFSGISAVLALVW